MLVTDCGSSIGKMITRWVGPGLPGCREGPVMCSPVSERGKSYASFSVDVGAMAVLRHMWSRTTSAPRDVGWPPALGLSLRCAGILLFVGLITGTAAEEGPELTDEQLRHGKVQLMRLVRDRPGMKQYRTRDGTPRTVGRHDAIRQWAVRKLAGEDVGEPVYWDPREPEQPPQYLADHQYPVRGERIRGTIRLRERFAAGEQEGELVHFELLWSSLVFELHNMALGREFERVYQQALLGRVSKQDWIVRNTRLEYLAEQKTMGFYDRVWRPWAAQNGYDASELDWFPEVRASYRDWFADIARDRTSYPWDTWGRWYDEDILPYLREVGLRPPITP